MTHDDALSPTLCPRCGALPFGCVRGCGGKPQHNENERPSTLERLATISPCGHYRYSLARRWGSGPMVTWVMLNPSTADAEVDDPTIRRCMSFSEREGGGGMVVVNLYAYRSSKPHHLLAADDPIGPENRDHLAAYVGHPDQLVIAAWGAWLDGLSTAEAANIKRGDGLLYEVADTFDVPLYCLGTTKAGAPRHPLYVKGDQPLDQFRLPWPSGSKDDEGSLDDP